MESLICLGRVAWSSSYTYILLLFAAAAFVAYIARPRNRGEAEKRLVAGELFPVDDDTTAATPKLKVECLEGAQVVFERTGFDGLTMSGAVSIAAIFVGKDVEILERVTPGFINDEAVGTARFTLDMTGPQWRHIKWSDEDSGLWCAFTLHVRPGIKFEISLRR